MKSPGMHQKEKGQLKNRKLFIMAALLGMIVFSVRLTHAQTQFVIPKRILPIEFDQKMDLSSWNHFNRVEGLFVGGELTGVSPSQGMGLVLGGGYSFFQNVPHYHLYGVKDFGKKINFEVGGGYLDHVESADSWIIGEIENSFAALLLHEDFRDYYGLKGWRGWLQLRIHKWIAARALFQTAQYTAVTKITDWHLLPNHKSFRPNPAVMTGRENLLRFSMVVDRMNNPIYPTQGFFCQAALEKALGGSADAFQKYSALFSTMRLFYPTYSNQRMGVLLRGGKTWNADDLPQHKIDFGGLGTLRGFRTKAFPDATAFVMARLTYFFGGDLFNTPLLDWIPFSDMIELGLFGESGRGWFRQVKEVRCETEPCIPNSICRAGRWHSDLGVSFSISGDLVRVDMAHPVQEKGPWRLTMRILPKW